MKNILILDLSSGEKGDYLVSKSEKMVSVSERLAAKSENMVATVNQKFAFQTPGDHHVGT